MHNELEAALENKKEIQTIPRSIFLYAYLILPLLFFIVVADIFFLNSKLLPHLGINALLLPLFIFIFNLPHIIASFVGFLDREYVGFYKKHLFLYLPLFLIATGILLFVNYELGLIFYFVNDVWHGLKQKAGIALILGARPGALHTVWTVIPFVLTSVIYVYLLLPQVFPLEIMHQVSMSILAGTVLFCLVTAIKVWKSAQKVRFYIFLFSIFFVFTYFFVLTGYVFFAILAFRFVHDVSAFAFYINHDHNRNLESKKNWLYQMLSFIPLPVVIITPFVAYLFAYIIRTVANGLEIVFSIVVLTGMTHFYLESIMWKRDSLHRKHVKVSD